MDIKTRLEPVLTRSGQTPDGQCAGCVFYPPNLPPDAYPEEDYAMLIRKNCSFDFRPGDGDCVQTRKTSCSLLDLGKAGSTP